ncbi:3-hydroxyacyl-CoA dehydrogenase [Hydrogenophaga taeniospiralis]|uniref:3-hydroxyacyl-CoA dehydrogenase n=1 Tax=Hydrogenophaga taeniospiralis TaxID=65656 RepID=UPI001CFB89DD|nr:3-hydroxyacyl-CoA dehydrogenase [Hydrogenophaga taeniospiralis]UCU96655.1 3-hydroxyacyl-CoA dehydrogenase [Hydrogenophaga taeniospiralis]
MTSLNNAPVLVVGAGIMGAGIAQVAAQAGHPVFLFDMREGAAAQAKAKLAATLDGLVAKGKITAGAAAATLARIEPIPSLDAAAGAALVVEAIVENLDAKRSLFRQLESVVGEAAILASNTSSISVTAIANGLLHPERFVGMHFFNPVPQMKLVEVVSGLQTDAAVAQAIEALSVAWGKVPVHARSTPGFIVNRIARPYYAETLALLQEQAATPQRLDACLKAAGFRMGPCELMDLIGHDTNFAVTNSVFEANFGDKRYVPSLVQRELVDGGLLGRKSGRGFYTYPEGVPALPAMAHEAPLAMGPVTVHGDGEIADRLEQLVIQGRLSGDAAPSRQRQSAWVGLDIGGARLVLTDGRTAGDIAAREGIADVAVFDRPLLWPTASGGTLAYAVAPQASAAWRRQAPAWLSALGFVPVPLADAPGLVVARTIAMLINEAADAVQQGVCTPEGADAAMKLGVNYPAGPFEWLARWSVAGVTQVMESLDAYYRGERYRISPWLRRQRA